MWLCSKSTHQDLTPKPTTSTMPNENVHKNMDQARLRRGHAICHIVNAGRLEALHQRNARRMLLYRQSGRARAWRVHGNMEAMQVRDPCEWRCESLPTCLLISMNLASCLYLHSSCVEVLMKTRNQPRAVSVEQSVCLKRSRQQQRRQSARPGLNLLRHLAPVVPDQP